MKAQIKMIESVFIIIIFVIILMIVIVFFARFQRSDVQFTRTEQSLRDSVQMAQIFSSLPEVACTESNAIRENCIDILKLETMDSLSSSELVYYYDLFRFGTVTIEQIYPEDGLGRHWVIYNVTRENAGFFSMAIPMALYDPVEGRNNFGIMEVRFYDN